jgi:hypothetical protein
LSFQLTLLSLAGLDFLTINPTPNQNEPTTSIQPTEAEPIVSVNQHALNPTIVVPEYMKCLKPKNQEYILMKTSQINPYLFLNNNNDTEYKVHIEYKTKLSEERCLQPGESSKVIIHCETTLTNQTGKKFAKIKPVSHSTFYKMKKTW